MPQNHSTFTIYPKEGDQPLRLVDENGLPPSEVERAAIVRGLYRPGDLDGSTLWALNDPRVAYLATAARNVDTLATHAMALAEGAHAVMVKVGSLSALHDALGPFKEVPRGQG